MPRNKGTLFHLREIPHKGYMKFLASNDEELRPISTAAHGLAQREKQYRFCVGFREHGIDRCLYIFRIYPHEHADLTTLIREARLGHRKLYNPADH